jgi:hypothetical protein
MAARSSISNFTVNAFHCRMNYKFETLLDAQHIEFTLQICLGNKSSSGNVSERQSSKELDRLLHP